MVIRVFVASSSGSVAIKKRQQDVVRFLEANRIEFEEVDITMSEEKRQWMYKNIPEDRQPAQGNPLPPQIFSDDRYCGDYDGFFESKESNTVFSFLGLKPTLASKEDIAIGYWVAENMDDVEMVLLQEAGSYPKDMFRLMTCDWEEKGEQDVL
ncbi:SH3 domain-binding glutamic acid-rich-like protein 2 [Willisornis vidua]|uniref:SH3 domain-binding glutamic acid-rich-like protein 2 n=1 Tax=Willisornis vidua TaxID=1566151 RepID=A0ABQ9D4E3_9PASS|nr:SH3 domain-binding glutamic acid-rich-like protein 2 [Willisornis vidua]